jgi:hypothetical protein
VKKKILLFVHLADDHSSKMILHNPISSSTAFAGIFYFSNRYCQPQPGDRSIGKIPERGSAGSL